MNAAGLVLRTLLHYRLSSAAVAAGALAAAAVLGGALLVGAALPASLARLVDERLGPVENAISGQVPFTVELATRLARELQAEAPGATVWPAWIAGGSCRARGASAGRVQVLGAALPGLEVQPGRCVLGAELARVLGASAGAEVEVWIGEAAGRGVSPLPAATRAPQAARLKVARVALEAESASLFALEPSQRPPRNCWMNREELAALASRPGGATHLFVQGAAGRLEAALGRALRLEDAGLRFRQAGEEGTAVLEFEALRLPGRVLAAARAAAADLGLPLTAVAANLAATLARPALPGRPGRAAPYCMIAGLDPFPVEGKSGTQGLLLNEWAARDLEARTGDRVEMRFFARQAWGGLAELEAAFPVLGVKPMQALWADPALTPELPGLTDAESVRDWDPPAELGLDLGRIRPIDEEYWDRHRAAPRLFLPLAAATRLWGGGEEPVTALRLPAAARERFREALGARLALEDLGVRLRAVRAEQLSAAGGTTDFGVLFLGFSFFLLVAAGLLVGLLFRLAVVVRAPQLGVLQALGFGTGRVLRLEAAAGGVLALAGAAAGGAGSIAYAALMVFGLNRWWSEALGSGFVGLSLAPGPILAGVFGSFLFGVAGVAWAVLGLARIPPGRLLAGETAGEAGPGRGRWAGRAALLMLAAAAAWIALGGGGPAAFLGAGALLIAAGLAGLAALFARGSRRPLGLGPFPLLRLALAGAGRAPGRSLLTAGLVGAAAFVLFTVRIHRGGGAVDPWEMSGPTGGYTLAAWADPPLPVDPGVPAGRRLLALGGESWWERVEVAALRVGPGGDMSCLNLYRSAAPRLAGVPEAWGRGAARFRFIETMERVDNPWTLLEVPLPGGEIPVVADAETARWTLHLPLGAVVEARDGAGRPIRLRLVGLLAGSLFQGELLVGEADFRRLFPQSAGFGRLLIRAAPGEQAEVAASLARTLAEHGLEIVPTADLLSAYARVAGAYMDAFGALGSLGLLLGVAGLAAVLLRTLAERRGELALLACLGFRRRRIVVLFAAENGLLALYGLLLGGLGACLSLAA